MTERNDNVGKFALCPRGADAIAYLLGEMTPPERLNFEAHAAGCPLCADELKRNPPVLGWLREAPESECSPGLTARIMESVSTGRAAHVPHSPRGLFTLPVWARRAAGILFVLGIAGLIAIRVFSRNRSGDEAILALRAVDAAPESASMGLPAESARRDAQAWLRQAQRADGGWKAGRGDALADYTPGVSGLAILALMDGGEKPLEGDNGAAIRRGIEFLIAGMNQEGLFGADFAGAPYNQGLATLALVEACVQESNATWRAAAERALGFIVTAQDAQGGWNYRHSAPGDVNTSISVWPLICLSHAHASGFENMEIPIRRGLAWLRGAVDPDGLMGYHRAGESPNGHGTLTAAGAVCLLKGNSQADLQVARRMLPAVRRIAEDPKQPMDFYRDFFVTQALRLARDEASGEVVETLGEKMLALQSRTGAWPATDRWSSVGGPVYATALAAMTLLPAQ